MQHGRILIFETDPLTSRFHASLLEEDGGYRVCEVNHPSSILEAAREFRPHLILLDAYMPDLEADSFAAALVRDPFLSATPVVFMSPHAVHSKDRAAWSTRVVMKPLDRDAILQTARNHCPRFQPSICL